MGVDKYAEELSDMRKAIDKHGGSYKVGDEAICLRFLMEYSMNPEKAAKMLVQFQNWRKLYMPLGYIPDSEVTSFLLDNAVALHGPSKKGWPVVVMFADKHPAGRHSVESARRFNAYILEKARASAPGSERVLTIVDMSHMTLKNLDAKLFVVGLQFQQKYYPGIVAKVFMVNAPKFFCSAWKIMAKVLPKSTTERVSFLEKNEGRDVLLAEVDAEVLPKMYGGKAELKLLQDIHPAHWGPSTTST